MPSEARSRGAYPRRSSESSAASTSSSYGVLWLLPVAALPPTRLGVWQSTPSLFGVPKRGVLEVRGGCCPELDAAACCWAVQAVLGMGTGLAGDGWLWGVDMATGRSASGWHSGLTGATAPTDEKGGEGRRLMTSFSAVLLSGCAVALGRVLPSNPPLASVLMR